MSKEQSSSASTDPLIKFRLIKLDSYSISPSETSELSIRSSPLLMPSNNINNSQSSKTFSKVPVIRIFGRTESGQKVMAHVHGSMSYFYVEYRGSLDPDRVHQYIRRLATSLNFATALSLNRSANNETNLQENRNNQYVGFINLCKGVPFYGYNLGYKYFLKISCLKSNYKKRMSELLRSGKVLINDNDNGGINRSHGCKVYEDHIPFNLQFMVDHNLYGCDWVKLSNCSFRRPLPDRIYLDGTVPESKLGPIDLDKASYCEIELDCHASDIMNRYIVKERQLHHDFTEFLTNDCQSGDQIRAEDQKLVQSLKQLWEDEERRREDEGKEPIGTINESGPTSQRFFKIGEQPNWSTESRHRSRIQELIRQERPKLFKAGFFTNNSNNNNNNNNNNDDDDDDDIQRKRFKSFIRSESNLSKLVPTSFQAVSSLHIQQWIKDDEESNPYGVWATFGSGFKNFATHSSTKKTEFESIDEELGLLERDGVDDDLNVDFEGIKTQMENYKVELEDDEDDLAIENDLIGVEEEEDNDEDNEDDYEEEEEGEGKFEDDQEEEVLGSKIGSNLTTPRKAKPIDLSYERVEVGDGFSQPKVGKITRFVERFSSNRTEQDSNLRTTNDEKAQINSSNGNNKVDNDHITLNDSLDQLARSNSALTAEFTRKQSVDQSLNEESVNFLKGIELSDYSLTQSTKSNRSPNIMQADTIEESCMNDMSQDEKSSDSEKGLEGYMNKKRLDQAINLTQSLRRMSTINDEIYHHSNNDKDGGVENRMKKTYYKYSTEPPSTERLINSLDEFGLPMKVYKDPFYSDPNDLTNKKREYGGRQYVILGHGMRFVEEFENLSSKGMRGAIEFNRYRINSNSNLRQRNDNYKDFSRVDGFDGSRILRWEFSKLAPSLKELEKSLKGNDGSKRPTTQKNDGFKYTPIKKKKIDQPKCKVSENDEEGGEKVKVEEGLHGMDFLAVEVHADSRGELRPDPKEDEIKVLFYCFKSEKIKDRVFKKAGIIMVKEDSNQHKFKNTKVLHSLSSTISEGEEEEGLEEGLGEDCFKVPRFGIDSDDCELEVVDSEIDLLNSLIYKVRSFDPEILTGFELESWSWGYIISRGRELDYDLIFELGRVKSETIGGKFSKKDDRLKDLSFGSTSIRLIGRDVLSIWKVLKGEVALNSYSFENVVYHVMRIRIPHYSFPVLKKMWESKIVERKFRVLNYYLCRVKLDCELIEETEIISRNSEISRTIGVDFISVITRGSQFKVESVMFRICKPENFILISPSREEVGKQNAAECTPLIMEPRSAFYKSPLVVLDFQSLYPSIMIAYNYCYSTCLGRVQPFRGINKLGTSILNLPDGLITLLKDHIIVSPNGLMFTKQKVRKSILSKMLSEILDTRIMVKQSMKIFKDDKGLTKMMNSRQLGLKLLANVTYGYTSASFSGRMPCVEIADAIVQTGRETLEKAIEHIHSVKEWDAKVVYGDTDSLFVYLPGRTKERAFKIGNEIAEAITKRNPAPVKLKFEKVYLPCVLMAKKRYVGAKYENEGDTEPVFDAKGIEVIRRDGIPALQKIQETCLKKLFETQDLSDIKAYLYRQWQKLLLGKVSIQDFIFAKEVRLGSYSERVLPPPAALVAIRKMEVDPRSEPAYGERVPFVIVKGAPQSRMRDRAVPPEMLLQNRLLGLDSEYYITRVMIPALARIFNLVGADVLAWYQSMPKFIRINKTSTVNYQNQNQQRKQENQKNEIETLEMIKSKSNNKKMIGNDSKFLVDEHFRSDRCLNCEEEGQKNVLCNSCGTKPKEVVGNLIKKVKLYNQSRRSLEMICKECSSLSPCTQMETSAIEELGTTRPSLSSSFSAGYGGIGCDSLDCPVLYSRVKSIWKTEDGVKLIKAVNQIDQGIRLDRVPTMDW
ncbi:hypothetical protein PPACK8108_LOCUS10462 [Phakopsora pachyrhizi]|uniref:DNA polymerase n=1 Tax=Phakopsora pachyrhizi TaxID=170000 RepID=A0AAV0B066_PHAPC|nr:hypothetical protein PPACK8108_LOCUS10462 [Phakopsora pachyrhizi]